MSAVLVPRFSFDNDDDHALLGALRGSQLVKAAVAEAEARQVAERKKLRAELDALIADASKKLPRLRGEVEAALQEAAASRALIVTGQAMTHLAIMEANAKITLAQHRAGEAQAKVTSASFAFTSKYDEIEKALRDSADGALGAFIRELNDLWHQTRRTPLVPQTLARTIRGARVEIASSNAKQVAARLGAIREAIATAEDFQLEPIIENLAERLDALRAGLPSVE